jgi:hypothetical protein
MLIGSTAQASALVVPVIGAPQVSLIRVRSPGVTCAEPGAIPDPHEPFYQLDISLGEGAQAPGTYPLSTSLAWAVGSAALCDSIDGSCHHTRASLSCDDAATIDISSIDDSEIVFSLSGTAHCWINGLGVLNGTYTAARCPMEPSAIAMADPALPDHLLIRTALPGISCAEPEVGDANGYWTKVEIHLPPSSQAVGTYPLETISGRFTNTCDPVFVDIECAPSFDGPASGTIEITSIDDAQVAFTLSGVDVRWDGAYTAPRCN